MAVDFKKSKHSRNTEYRFLPDQIEIRSELNGRHDLPDIDWLIADMLKHGQHTPVTVRNDGGRAVLVAGFSRWRAVSLINKKKLSAAPMFLRATYVDCNEAEGFLRTVSENRMRNDVTDLDNAFNIKLLQTRFSMPDEEIVKLYFPTAKKPEEIKTHLRWLKKTVKLASLTKEAQKAVTEGRVKPTAASAIAEMSEEQQREAVAKEGLITSKDVKPPPKVSKASKLASLVNTLLKPLDGKLLRTDKFPEAVVDRAALIALHDLWSAE
jgi:ParB-like chromosome segregation protein Spo0J